jgi:hypothetical protein
VRLFRWGAVLGIAGEHDVSSTIVNGK